MTFLEASLCAILVCTMLLSGFAMVDYYSRAGNLQRLVDSTIHDSTIRPFNIGSNGGTIELSTQSDLLRDHCDQTVLDISEKLSQPPLNLSADQYRIEMAYVEVGVDPQSGQSLRFEGGNPAYLALGGNLPTPAEIDSNGSLSSQFGFLAHPGGDFPDDSFLYATPSIFGGTTTLGYLDRAVLVGLRVIYSLEASPWRNLYQNILSHPFLYQTKVIALRGDIDS